MIRIQLGAQSGDRQADSDRVIDESSTNLSVFQVPCPTLTDNHLMSAPFVAGCRLMTSDTDMELDEHIERDLLLSVSILIGMTWNSGIQIHNTLTRIPDDQDYGDTT